MVYTRTHTVVYTSIIVCIYTIVYNPVSRHCKADKHECLQSPSTEQQERCQYLYYGKMYKQMDILLT